MKTHRATLHMALAAYMAPDENEQVLKIAKRVYKRTISKRTKSTMKSVLESNIPASLVLHVYED
jgi:hypothetical protein